MGPSLLGFCDLCCLAGLQLSYFQAKLMPSAAPLWPVVLLQGRCQSQAHFRRGTRIKQQQYYYYY